MELVFADEGFKINGVSYPGFPIILTAELRSIPEVSAFLIYRCLHRGELKVNIHGPHTGKPFTTI